MKRCASMGNIIVSKPASCNMTRKGSEAHAASTAHRRRCVFDPKRSHLQEQRVVQDHVDGSHPVCRLLLDVEPRCCR